MFLRSIWMFLEVGGPFCGCASTSKSSTIWRQMGAPDDSGFAQMYAWLL